MGISVGVLPHDSKEHHCGEFQNSLSWKSDGKPSFASISRLAAANHIFYLTIGYLYRNGTRKSKLGSEFGKGDTIGCGLMIDSFNRRVLFYTLNGQFVGFFQPLFEVPMSALVVPCISSDAKAEITPSFISSFKWNGSEYKFYKPPSDDAAINSLPNEILETIIRYSATFPAQAALNLTRVNRKWRTIADSNNVWRPLFLKRWDTQNPELKAKSWKKLYRNRQKLSPGTSTGPTFASASSPSSPPFIDNCAFDFGCPMKWESLTVDDKLGPNERRCNHCKSSVYKVSTKAELMRHVALGRCVTLNTEVDLAALLKTITYTGRMLPLSDDEISTDDDEW